jgi:linoleoyl-CoA desaturase
MAGTSTRRPAGSAATIRSASEDAHAADPKRTGAARDRVRFAPSGDFQRVLQQRVREQLGQHRPGENWALLGQMLVAGAWFYASYAVLVFVPLPAWGVAVGAASLGLAIAGLLMMVIHDAAHHAVSARKTVNEGIGWLTSVALAISPDWWRAKHNGLHHPFTNVAGFDDDIDLGSLVRTLPDQPWKPWHRYQHLYAFVLCPLMYLNMVFTADLRFIFSGRVGNRRVEQPTARRAARLLTKKLAGVTLFMAVAFAFQPAVDVVLATIFATLVAGATVSLIFQVQHCVEGTAFPSRDAETGRVDRSWAVVQAEGAADFATGNRLLTWYSGALNYHIEHHLFPRLPHNRLAEIRPIVRSVCAEFGVRQTEFPTFRAALGSHARFLRRMGSRPGLPVDSSRGRPTSTLRRIRAVIFSAGSG